MFGIQIEAHSDCLVQLGMRGRRNRVPNRNVFKSEWPRSCCMMQLLNAAPHLWEQTQSPYLSLLGDLLGLGDYWGKLVEIAFH